MKTKYALVLLPLVALLASCGTMQSGSFGQSRSAVTTADRTVRKGMSQAQVRDILGHPNQTVNRNGHEVWYYRSSNAMAVGVPVNFMSALGPIGGAAALAYASGQTVSSTNTVVSFTGSGRVMSVNRTTTQKGVGRNLF
jgi:outer membrane protein assembly factor BamE (lipoprotein component of BamABCDE complex)